MIVCTGLPTGPMRVHTGLHIGQVRVHTRLLTGPMRVLTGLHTGQLRVHMGLIMGSIGAVGIMLGVTIVTRGITPPVIVGMVLLFAVISVVTGVIRPSIMTKVSPAPIIPRSLARRLAPRKNLQSFQDHSTHSRLLQKD